MPPSGTKVVVVCDAGPLIALGRLDLLGLLPRLFVEVQVPEAVLTECFVRPELADAQRIEFALRQSWLTRCEADPIAAEGLGSGERAAIGRALLIGAALLTDDRAARGHAQLHGLVVFGTLGVLVRAKRAALLTDVAPLIARLRSGGHHLGDATIAAALKLAGE